MVLSTLLMVLAAISFIDSAPAVWPSLLLLLALIASHSLASKAANFLLARGHVVFANIVVITPVFFVIGLWLLLSIAASGLGL